MNTNFLEGLSSEKLEEQQASLTKLKNYILGNKPNKIKCIRLGVLPKLVKLLGSYSNNQQKNTNDEELYLLCTRDLLICIGSFLHSTPKRRLTEDFLSQVLSRLFTLILAPTFKLLPKYLCESIIRTLNLLVDKTNIVQKQKFQQLVSETEIVQVLLSLIYNKESKKKIKNVKKIETEQDKEQEKKKEKEIEKDLEMEIEEKTEEKEKEVKKEKEAEKEKEEEKENEKEKKKQAEKEKEKEKEKENEVQKEIEIEIENTEDQNEQEEKKEKSQIFSLEIFEYSANILSHALRSIQNQIAIELSKNLVQKFIYLLNPNFSLAFQESIILCLSYLGNSSPEIARIILKSETQIVPYCLKILKGKPKKENKKNQEKTKNSKSTSTKTANIDYTSMYTLRIASASLLSSLLNLNQIIHMPDLLLQMLEKTILTNVIEISKSERNAKIYNWLFYKRILVILHRLYLSNKILNFNATKNGIINILGGYLNIEEYKLNIDLFEKLGNEKNQNGIINKTNIEIISLAVKCLILITEGNIQNCERVIEFGIASKTSRLLIMDISNAELNVSLSKLLKNLTLLSIDFEHIFSNNIELFNKLNQLMKVDGKNPELRENAAYCVGNLICGISKLKKLFIQQEGIKLLNTLILSENPIKIQKFALFILRNLLFKSNTEMLKQIIDQTDIPLILNDYQDSNEEIQIECASILVNLTCNKNEFIEKNLPLDEILPIVTNKILEQASKFEEKLKKQMKEKVEKRNENKDEKMKIEENETEKGIKEAEEEKKGEEEKKEGEKGGQGMEEEKIEVEKEEEKKTERYNLRDNDDDNDIDIDIDNEINKKISNEIKKEMKNTDEKYFYNNKKNKFQIYGDLEIKNDNIENNLLFFSLQLSSNLITINNQIKDAFMNEKMLAAFLSLLDHSEFNILISLMKCLTNFVIVPDKEQDKNIILDRKKTLKQLGFQQKIKNIFKNNDTIIKDFAKNTFALLK
ncbi:armadillo repeat-containing protein [Anaeramoeba flamelloides]|uniref:Armadillo repeat-containing protein n=1 Tax=Anaeramoeba flamelloides TaxID=1746091 RepID=A0AAV7YWM4_9EUKA|nr:armadillo repeat-containing protein [Anaeramoeba flamelloides]